LFNLGFERPGDVERDRFTCLFPGDEKGRMLWPLVMAGTVFFATFSGSGYEGAFDPGAELLNLSEQRKAFGLELGA